MSYTIRPATESDIPVLLAMIAELGAHFGDAPTIQRDSLRRDVFGSDPYIRIAVADTGRELLGYAAWYFRYYLDSGRSALHLHHLHVRPAARRRGVGRALVAHVTEVARSRGSLSVQLSTAATNIGARSFYEELGFVGTPPKDSIMYRLDLEPAPAGTG